jgi:hypothetical protein
MTIKKSIWWGKVNNPLKKLSKSRAAWLEQAAVGKSHNDLQDESASSNNIAGDGDCSVGHYPKCNH